MCHSQRTSINSRHFICVVITLRLFSMLRSGSFYLTIGSRYTESSCRSVCVRRKKCFAQFTGQTVLVRSIIVKRIVVFSYRSVAAVLLINNKLRNYALSCAQCARHNMLPPALAVFVSFRAATRLGSMNVPDGVTMRSTH